jgi:Tfp pilus assembly protein PilV
MLTVIKNNKAFTLVEALVALVLLSFALLGFYRIHIRSVQLADYNKDMLMANQFARSKIDSFKSMPYATAVAQGNGSDNSTSAPDSTSGNVFFLRSWTISPYNSNGVTDTSMITVTVGWNSIGRCTSLASCDFTYNLDTLISRKSIY